jgi:hypothetical protein
MNAIPCIDSSRQFPLDELEEVDSAIQSAALWMDTLQRRRETLFAELDKLTRPALSMTPVTQQRIGPGFSYRGEMSRKWTYIDIHIGLLRKLWTDFPDRREAMARAVARHGLSRRYVSSSVGQLFRWMSESDAKKYSRELIDGWFIDTNINLERMRRILPAAVAAAGLTWGLDVRVYWRAEKI